MPVIPANNRHKIGGLWSRLVWQKARPYLQNNKSKMGWRHKVLSSSPSSKRKKIYTHTQMIFSLQ
jgi:hypothetical protein